MSKDNEINISIRIAGKHLAIALIAMVAISLIIPLQIFAQHSDRAVSPKVESGWPEIPGEFIAENMILGELWYQIQFTTATTGIIKAIEATFPNEFIVTEAELIGITGVGPGSLSVSGQTLIYTIYSESWVFSDTTITLLVSKLTNTNYKPLDHGVILLTKDAEGALIDGYVMNSSHVVTTVEATFRVDRVSMECTSVWCV